MTTGYAVVCDELSVGYDDRSVLCDISFRVQQGQSVILLGHNGAGKSTLLRTLFGLHPALNGRFQTADLSDSAVTPRSLIKRGVRFLAQGTRCFEHMVVRDSRNVLARQYGMKAGRFPMPMTQTVKLTTRTGKLSIGERKLEALTLLSAGDPRVFLLDEPLAGLDDRNKRVVAKWVKDLTLEGVSFVIADHEFMYFGEAIQQAIVLRDGKVSFLGQLKELISDQALFAKVYL